MIWFLILFDTFLLEKVFSTICFLQLSYNNFFHVSPYFSLSIYVPSKTYLIFVFIFHKKGDIFWISVLYFLT